MNKWKIAFWTCLTTLIIVLIGGLYSIIDQGTILTYSQDGYADTENDLNTLTKIINETDLTKGQIKKSLKGHELFQYMNFKRDTISLDRVNLIFNDNRVAKITKQW
jgi:hypothetical protein